MMDFVHLRLHTEYSVVDSTLRVDEAIAAAAQDGQGALALTDLNNLFAAVKFYKAARAKGVKPILGAEVTVEGCPGQAAAASNGQILQGQASRLLLLVQNQQGYLNLCELLTRSWTQSPNPLSAALSWDALAEFGAGLIVLSGASSGLVGQALLAGEEARAADLALQLAQLFPIAFIWKCNAQAALVTKNTLPPVRNWRRACNCRWWPRTLYSFCKQAIFKRTKPASALPMVRRSPAPNASSALAQSNTLPVVPICRHALPICPAPWPTAWP
jgi:DNA polymerase III alpha subunit